MTQEEFLASMSSAIASLQKAPGRLLQSLEQSSAEVWSNSNSGVGANAKPERDYSSRATSSRSSRRAYSPAHQRQEIDGRRDALALARYGGERGFTAVQLRALIEGVAARDESVVREDHRDPGELPYGELLAWYGLRFAGGAGESWNLEVRPRATGAREEASRRALDIFRPTHAHALSQVR